jgi:cytochrome c oxidase assembly protein subunit 15
VLALDSWIEHRRARRLPTASAISPWWATATLAWVCAQGAFGALTVTMKLYPAIVTAHLLGGVGMLVLLAAQAQGYVRAPLRFSRGLFAGTLAVFVLSVVQTALGGWVSTNYAVLACADFPTCQGSWWPAMDFEHGFALWRDLGQTGDGGWLPFEALTAIHQGHRLGAAAVLVAVALLAWRLVAAGRTHPELSRWALMLGGLALWQLATGVATVVFGWPLLAALAHAGGAAALVALLTVLLARAWPASSGAPAASPAEVRLDAPR